MTANNGALSTVHAETAGCSQAPAAERSSNSKIRSKMAARSIGILVLAGWFTYGPGGAVTSSIVTAPDLLANVAANQTLFTLGAVMMLLNSAAVVGIGVMVFPMLKRHSERVAVGYLATRILEGALLAVGIMSLLSLTGLSEAYASADSGGVAHFETLGALAVQLNDLSYQIGMATLGVGSLFFCSLLLRTALIPRTLAAWGVIGYGVFAAGMVLDMFGFDAGTLLTIPGGLFELVFATWLIVNGFHPSATDRATAAVDGAVQQPDAR